MSLDTTEEERDRPSTKPLRPSFFESAPAKINLYLHVTGKRADGYHTLDSLTVFAHDIADRIRIHPAPAFSFEMIGPFAQEAAGGKPCEANLAVRAARVMREIFNIPLDFKLTLEKMIPVGAGLGGGSADAGAVIRLLERYASQNPEHKSLLSLGADVPVCHAARASRFLGIGEDLRPAPTLPALPAILVWPRVACPTRGVFKAMGSDAWTSAVPALPPSFSNAQDLALFLKEKTTNSMTHAACTLHPEIRRVLGALEKQGACLLTRMSGSGSSCFALFGTDQDANQACDSLKKEHPDWWIQTTALG